MALTQARAFGALSGGQYGSFAGRGGAAHPVDAVTQPRANGAHTGRRYGSFSGRSVGAHPVGELTQARAFGTHTGQRYGAFGGRVEDQPTILPPASAGGGRRKHKAQLRNVWPAEYLARLQAEDDALLLVIAQMIADGAIH